MFACILDKNGYVLDKATNTTKTHPLAKLFGYEYGCQHAEFRVIVKHGLDNCKGKNMAVFRTTPGGNVSMAKPCSSCQRVIKNAGIRTVYYTNWDGDIEEESYY